MERHYHTIQGAELGLGGIEPPEHVPPVNFVDYWDWSKIKDNRSGVRTGRLAPWLRDAARTRNPQEILRRAVLATFRPTTNNALAESQALADLAVTGRAAFTAFIANPPQDEALFASVRPSLAEVVPERIHEAVRRVLDRAYTVAWALRGSPSQRKALRSSLGWIALSSEDDSPHAPTNIPATGDLMGELSLRIGRSDQALLLRCTLMLPEVSDSDPLPNISSRPIPLLTTFTDALHDRRAFGYDELFLFVHGLGSRAEESDAFKRMLIERGPVCNRRFAVLSVDMPGMGYSSRLDLDDIIARRSRGHHGFALPNGVGSNFPLLGLYRDTLVEICNTITGGVQYVMGGSLGGNMTLWLAAEPMFSDLDPSRNEPKSVISFLSWSPASIWESYERSRDTPFEGNGTHMDIGKYGAKKRSLSRMHEPESEGIRWKFFELMQRGEEIAGIHFDDTSWGYPPTKAGLLQQSEFYSEQYRRVFWAAGYEQVTFSHQEPLTPSGYWPFQTIRKPLFLASGGLDVGSHGVMDIYNQVVAVTDRIPDVPGQCHLVEYTRHSISDERPMWLAGTIFKFLCGTELQDQWQLFDTLQVAIQRSGDDDNHYALVWEGSTMLVEKYGGHPQAPWQQLDDNPATKKIVAAAGKLYQLHNDGSIWMYVGPVTFGPQWLQLDNNLAAIDIVADGDNLYQQHRDGRIWKFKGEPLTGWAEVDNNPETKKIVAAGGKLYQLHNSGSIWLYMGPLTEGSRWLQLDNNPASIDIIADGDNLYQQHRDGRLWKYTGQPFTGWVLLDRFVDWRLNVFPGYMQIATINGRLYKFNKVDKTIWQYTGKMLSGWQMIGDDNATSSVLVAGNSFYQSRHQNGQSSLWKYHETKQVAIRTIGGQYLHPEVGLGNLLVAQSSEITPSIVFTMVALGGHKVAFRAHNGKLIHAGGGGGGAVLVAPDKIDSWEAFEKIDLGNDVVAFKAANGQYLCAESGGGREVVANRDHIGDWEKFVLILSPLDKGSVQPDLNNIIGFASSLENWTYQPIVGSIDPNVPERKGTDLFVCGNDKTLWYRHASIQSFFDEQSGGMLFPIRERLELQVEPWQRLGGMVDARSTPSVLVQPDRDDVAILSMDKAIWYRSRNSVTGWSNWISLGGNMISGPSLCSWELGRLDVFAQGHDNTLWHRWYVEYIGSWSEWESLGGSTILAPTAISWGPNRIDLFTLGRDRAIWHKWFDRGWSKWKNLGGQFNSKPTAVALKSGRIELFARSADNSILQKSLNGARWSAWKNLGGQESAAADTTIWDFGSVESVVKYFGDTLERNSPTAIGRTVAPTSLGAEQTWTELWVRDKNLNVWYYPVAGNFGKWSNLGKMPD